MGWFRKLTYDLGISLLAGVVIVMVTTGPSPLGWWVTVVSVLMVVLSSAPISTFAQRRLSREVFSTLATPRIKTFIPIAILASFIVSLASQYHQDQETKQKALQLSTEILSFIKAKREGEPPLPRPETWQEDVEKSVRYSQSMAMEFSATYGGRARAVCTELAERGLGDKSFYSMCESLINYVAMRMVGEELAALAEQLPKPEKWFSGRWAFSVVLSLALSLLLWIVLGVWEQRLSEHSVIPTDE